MTTKHRWIALVLLVLVAATAQIVYSAAPAASNVIVKVTACDTVSIQHSAAAWQPIGGPYIYTMTDTCYVLVTVSGTALLDQTDKLYIGVREIKTNDSVCADTMLFQTDVGTGHYTRMPFSFVYLDSLESQTDDVDTVFINAACGGGGWHENVIIEDVYIQIEILDKDT